jgi:hypothetical protein
MRVLFHRAFTFVALLLTLAGIQPASAWAQLPPSRGVSIAVLPEIRTKIEAVLATPNVLLTTDYYRIDMRFGPNLRIDAVVVETVEPRWRALGLRVSVRDDGNRNRQEGTSYLDLEEAISLSRALTPMAELAAKGIGRDDRRGMDLSFTTNGGFRLAVREFGRVQRAYLSTGLIDPISTSIDVTDLGTLKHAFDQALEILEGK